MRVYWLAFALVVAGPVHAETLVSLGTNAAGAQMSVDRDSMITSRSIIGQREFGLLRRLIAVCGIDSVRHNANPSKQIQPPRAGRGEDQTVRWVM